MFQEEFLKATTAEERLEILTKVEGSMHLTDVVNPRHTHSKPDDPNHDWYFWHSGLSPHFTVSKLPNGLLTLCDKNFQMTGLCDGKFTEINFDLTKMVCGQFKSNTILDMAKKYQERGWLDKSSQYRFAVAVFADSIYPLETCLYQYVLNLDIDISQLIEKIYDNGYKKPHLDGILLLFQKLLSNNRDLAEKYARKQLVAVPNREFYDFCITNNLSIVSNMSDLIALIPKLDGKQCREAIEEYKKVNLYLPDPKFYSVLIHICPDLVSDEVIDEDILDSILFYGSLPLIHDILARGFSFKDKNHRLYVPCPDCYNGEGHYCNWRYVSSNFVCNMRTNITGQGIPLAELQKFQGELKDFWCAYGHFNGVANNKELYTEAGVDELSWDDDKEQRIYRIPPVKVERNLTEQSTNMKNNIPCYFIRLEQS